MKFSSLSKIILKIFVLANLWIFSGIQLTADEAVVTDSSTEVVAPNVETEAPVIDEIPENATAVLREEQGVDGLCFLKDVLLSPLENVAGMRVLDIGYIDGASTLYMVDKGVQHVDILDASFNDIEGVRTHFEELGFSDKVTVTQGSTEAMPYPEESFDAVFALDVANECLGLNDILAELKRVMKYESLAYVLIPSSLPVLFCEDAYQASIVSSIDSQLAQCRSEEDFKNLIENMPGLIRGAFNFRSGKWRRIKKENELFFGDLYYYKGAEGLKKTRYHPRSEYMSIFLRDGFSIEHMQLPSFRNEAERVAYNNSCTDPSMKLGSNYIGNAPFILFIVEKS
ncbi:hypothetical protein CLAVI_000443 [Candidatus Clavichlamydia salmonicola]|uniref:class I SAM-dependent methyltransferase n=1 Tax=Candidatus Clavichlamydia salmonicola TaxID=469812 RepID=UPI001890BEA5|nr:methyltransferase domain-containing protein [Candidatus Clavichlamydia salmonicola]MBF5050824.1 hypothetical protein [Candidatus Clavichlamydia salmonicola]